MIHVTERENLKRLIHNKFSNKKIKKQELKDWFLKEKFDKGLVFGSLTGEELILIALSVGVKIIDTNLKAKIEKIKVEEVNYKNYREQTEELNKIFTKDLLIKLHINNNMSGYEIAKIYEVNPEVVMRRLKKYGIKRNKIPKKNTELLKISKGAC